MTLPVVLNEPIAWVRSTFMSFNDYLPIIRLCVMHKILLEIIINGFLSFCFESYTMNLGKNSSESRAWFALKRTGNPTLGEIIRKPAY